mmetsp:Transcript_4184/g.14906  ORF Transcript_4184/g.14906 Transcript_4184/m.14906 type:complete len:80 (+) Transcript_4184:274-513(+)
MQGLRVILSMPICVHNAPRAFFICAHWTAAWPSQSNVVDGPIKTHCAPRANARQQSWEAVKGVFTAGLLDKEQAAGHQP